VEEVVPPELLSDSESTTTEGSGDSDMEDVWPIKNEVHQIIQSSKNCDGAGRCSPVLVDRDHPDMDKTFLKRAECLKGFMGELTDFVKQKGVPGIIRDMQDGHGDGWREEPLKQFDEEIDDMLLRWIPKACWKNGVDWSVQKGQPFRLQLLRALLVWTEDEDVAIIDQILSGGVKCYIDEEVPPSGLWPDGRKDSYVPDKTFEVWDSNYSSMTRGSEDYLLALQAKLDGEFSNQFAEVCPREEIESMGVLAWRR